MKTTVEIPDAIYRQIKARAALQGQTIKDFLMDAVRAKLAKEVKRSNGKLKKPLAKTGWQAVYGAADPQQAADLQRIIDEEFSRIDPEGWE
jgi:hypothetical protein